MTQHQTNETVNELMDQGKKIVSEGNARHIVVRNANGEKLVDVTVTVAAIIAVVLLMVQPFGTFITIAAVAYGVYSKVKIEVVRDLSDDDEVVEVHVPDSE